MIPTFVRAFGAALALALSFVALAQQKASDIPVETFMRRAENQAMSLSPDGQLLAALTPLNGRDNLVVVDLKKRTRTTITSFSTADVIDFEWVNAKRIFFRVANGRDAQGRAEFLGSYAIDADGNDQRDLSRLVYGNSPSAMERRPGLAVIRHKEGDEVYAEMTLRRREASDVYVLNTRTGRHRLVTEDAPADTLGWLLDWKGVPRVAWSTDLAVPKTTAWYRADEKSPWKALNERDAITGDADQMDPITFDADNKTLYVSSRAGGRDRAAIFKYDPETRKVGEVVFEHPLVDLTGRGLVVDENKGRVEGLLYSGDKPGVAWLVEDMAKLQRQVDATLPGKHNVITRSRDPSNRVLVFSQSDVDPGRYYLLNRDPLSIEELPPTRPWLKPELMSPRKYMPYKARDGLDIPAWVTIPKESAGKNLPLVVHVHGGPWSRGFEGIEWTRYSEAQFFASRGYAVLEAEPRASLGFGRKHLEAGYRQWGMAMQDDLTDGVLALVKAGIVDKGKVCIYGGSYGGYAALWGPIKDPELYRCAIPWIAVSDLVLLQTATWSDTNRGRMNWDPSMRKRMGSARDERAMLEKVSPYLHADRIKAPMLLVMGSDDQRVPIEHGNKMRSALQTANVKHEYVVYDHEGHGFNKDENVNDFFRRVEKFLAEHLK
jgi:dipeptidyl aminopeptidase/acylaminoacyl peptidase